MKNLKSTMYLVLLVSIFQSCSSSRYATTDGLERKPVYRIQAGINHGGIAENDDLSLLEGTTIPDVDAYSGATSPGANAGAHVLLPVRRKNSIETGMDLMFNKQTFTYVNQATNFSGDRNILTSQVLLPISYNIGFFRDSHGESRAHLKFGYVFQLNWFHISDEVTGLPEYSTDALSRGATFGFDTTPFTFKNGAKLGIYLDVYRGSQIYEDVFNQWSFVTPGSCYLKAGLVYQFRNDTPVSW